MTNYLKNCLPLPDFKIKTIDVGAMPEGVPCYQPLLDQNLAEIIAFEPGEQQYQLLTEVYKDTDFKFLPYFLGNGQLATCYVTRYPGCSSLYEPDPSVIDLFTAMGTDYPRGNFSIKETHKVQTHTLDEFEQCQRCDYIKLDVQGGELDVLQHASKVLENITVIECEVEFVPIYKKQPLFGDIQVYLQSQGFLLHKMIDVGGRCFRPIHLDNQYKSMSQLLWADAIFVKDFTQLKQFSNDQLLKCAVILNDIYYSYDLVNILLQQYDQNQQTNYSSRYISYLEKIKTLKTNFMSLKEFV